MSKNAGTLPKMRTFSGKVKEIVARACFIDQGKVKRKA
jgi:hypothetical protein